jgi:uncharacterized protein
MSARFLGRQEELTQLKKLFRKPSASLVVIQGRRRVGKSRLIEEFAQGHLFYRFSGIPPTKLTTIQSELNEFSKQLSIQTGLPEIIADDWTKLFILLAEKIKKNRIIILLDEISWMGSKDPDFLGKLKNAWDIHFKTNPELILICCGSVSVWIEENILSSTGFLGRISYRLTLEELPLSDCRKFWDNAGGKIAPYEIFKVLSVTGGIPRYLEEIKPTFSAEENIKDLCFRKGGALVNEFNEIFSDLFSKQSNNYKKIIQTLSGGPLEIKDICTKLKIRQTGYISECLEHLVKSGFVTRDFTWNLKSEELSKLSHFRLSDNYLRFYLRYIDKIIHRIQQDEFAFQSLSLLPNWNTIMGFQFENLVLKNRRALKNRLGLKSEEVVSDNPYFQRKTARFPGCQIDYLIQMSFGMFYACEIKFTQREIGNEIVYEMKKKLNAFYYPKRFSCRPVLIHVNGVSEEVVSSGFFAEIIDFGMFLN